jgi:NTE family protein
MISIRGNYMALKRIGFSFSGGGIKAYAQIGIVKYLNEQGIFATGFSGTSMGSIVATLMACGLDIDAVETAMLEIEQEIIKHKLFNPTNAQFFPLILNDASGLIKPNRFVEILDKQLTKCNKTRLQDLSYPIIINAVDLNSGKIVIFTNQKQRFKNHTEYLVFDDALIVEAVQASCSFPMVFETMMWRDLQLVDGGVALNAPVLPLKQIGFDHILSITMGIRSDYHTTTKIRDIASRVVEIIINEADANAIKHAALNINAFDKNIGIFTLGKGKDAIE